MVLYASVRAVTVLRAVSFIALVNVGGCHACLAVLLADDDDAGQAAAAPTATATATATNAEPEPTFAPLENTTTTPTATAAPVTAQGSGWSGRYACFQLRMSVLGGVKVNFVPGVLSPFTITGSTYESGGEVGTVKQEGPIVAFHGGKYDGWRGYTGTDSTGAYVQFKNGKPQEPEPQLKHMDYKCYRQK